MKNKFKYLVLICIFFNLLSGCTSVSNDVNLETPKIMNYEEVKDSLIRFHVIANSDTDEDQNLKLKIRDKVIDYLYPYLNNSNSLQESRKIIKNNMNEVQKIAECVIKDNNYSYKVKLELSRENFPEKSYGNITLPQGNYEAFRIIIGDGKGRNWWCVMFPPLCFVDESKAQIQYENTENKINQEIEKENSNEKVKIKFKIIEVIKDLF
ncbi:stage II sporulation protein R [Clostridium uliginosum]|uniref:Stage II sporulation protein R n=1 Tax=Clostridium uliginosum TaxID=119641 RepID=A0A1I1IBL4_9CLOT|nr:stage II sporulation protein R [Clostridium uliginosum]SFC33627.1 stage II sporulation protein R [Clostridium uliginosum]